MGVWFFSSVCLSHHRDSEWCGVETFAAGDEYDSNDSEENYNKDHYNEANHNRDNQGKGGGKFDCHQCYFFFSLYNFFFTFVY